MYYLYYLYYIYYYNWCIVICETHFCGYRTQKQWKKFMNMSYLTSFQSYSYIYISITQLLIFIKDARNGYLRYANLQSLYQRISQSFYFWDYLRTIVYSTPSVGVLCARIQQVCQDLTYTWNFWKIIAII